MDKCPNCGFTDEIVISKFGSVMNNYVNEKGEKVCMNTDQKSYNLKGVKWIREDLLSADYNEKQRARQQVVPQDPVPSITPKESALNKPTAPALGAGGTVGKPNIKEVSADTTLTELPPREFPGTSTVTPAGAPIEGSVKVENKGPVSRK